MKRKNTLWSLVLALVMVLGVFAPLSALANTADKETVGKVSSKDISTERPSETNVTIHKLQADSYDSTKVPAKHNGGELDEDQLKTLGTKVKELDGVTFTCYKLKDEAQLKLFEKTPENYSTVDQVKAVAGVTEYKPDIVSANGAAAGPITTKDGKGVTVQIKDEGYYWFVESGKPENVSSALAVPFGISIPVTNPVEIKDNDNKTHDAGTVYLKNVHVYPKNVTGDLPKVDKDVNELKQKKATYKIGDTITWFITGDIPANLKEYKTYYLTDNLDTKLTYVGNPKVLYGTYADKAALEAEKNTIDGTTNKTGIVPESYYTITKPTGTKGGELKLELTEAGRKALYSESDPKHKLYFYFETKINEDAIMGKEIENNVTLKFINTPDGDKEKEEKPTETPKVITGGKLFKKVEAGTDTPLPDAVFTIKHQKDGTEPKDDAWKNVADLKWTEDLFKANKTAIEDGKFAIKTKDKEIYTATDSNTTLDQLENSVIYLRSNAQGDFEIKGLELSEYNPKTWNGSKLVDGTVVKNYYALKEVKAPADYGLIDEYKPFDITETSYYKTETLGLKTTTATTPGDADPDKINNKKLTIPQTGGMGTMIFMVAGLALMGGAFVAMRKRSAEQA